MPTVLYYLNYSILMEWVESTILNKLYFINGMSGIVYYLNYT